MPRGRGRRGDAKGLKRGPLLEDIEASTWKLGVVEGRRCALRSCHVTRWEPERCLAGTIAQREGDGAEKKRPPSQSPLRPLLPGSPALLPHLKQLHWRRLIRTKSSFQKTRAPCRAESPADFEPWRGAADVSDDEKITSQRRRRMREAVERGQRGERG